jgi:hypothetical protein
MQLASLLAARTLKCFVHWHIACSVMPQWLDQASWLKHDPPVYVIKWDYCYDTPMQIALVWSFLRDLSEEKTRTQPGRWATPKKREHPVWPLGDTVEHVTLA